MGCGLQVIMQDLFDAWTAAKPGEFLPQLRVLSLCNNEKLGPGVARLLQARGISPTTEELDIRLCGMDHFQLM
jgi:hypothetical protein